MAEKNNLPSSIAIIMDGNGRWAKKRGKIRVFGHRNGVKSVRENVTECARIGVKELTLYALSSENYTRRPRKEVNYLMKLLVEYLEGERRTIMDNDIVFSAIGRIKDLPDKVRGKISELTELSKDNGGMKLRLALNYGGRMEILDAVRKIVREERDGRRHRLSEESFRKYLYDPEMSDPDLLIRTGGDLRVSNFLLWQISYSEIYCTPVLWPDFRKERLHEAIDAFRNRERRFGGL